MPRRRIALLDVDQTLLYNQNDMNDALIEALVEQGVVDLYLFTNMDLTDIRCCGQSDAPLSRKEVVDYLESKGLIIHGVITPADPYFPQYTPTQAVDAAFKLLYMPLMLERSIINTPLNLNDYSSRATLEYLFTQIEWTTASYTLREAGRLHPNEHKKIARPGLCLVDRTTGTAIVPTRFIHRLNEAVDFFITGTDATSNREQYLLRQEPLPSEYDIDIDWERYASPDPKAAMLLHAIRKGIIRPHTDIYYFDDRQDHLDHVSAQFNHYRPEGASLYTCHVPADLASAMQDSQKAAYRNCLVSSEKEKYSSSFLLKILTHPAIPWISTLLILAGCATVVCGGIGLAGIGLGLSLIAATSVTTIGAMGVVGGLGMSGAHFFSLKKQTSITQDLPITTSSIGTIR